MAKQFLIWFLENSFWTDTLTKWPQELVASFGNVNKKGALLNFDKFQAKIV